MSFEIERYAVSQSVDFFSQAELTTECEGWDLNPRTSTGPGPQPGAVDHAWLPSRLSAEGEIFEPLYEVFRTPAVQNTTDYLG